MDPGSSMPASRCRRCQYSGMRCMCAAQRSCMVSQRTSETQSFCALLHSGFSGVFYSCLGRREGAYNPSAQWLLPVGASPAAVMPGVSSPSCSICCAARIGSKEQAWDLSVVWDLAPSCCITRASHVHELHHACCKAFLCNIHLWMCLWDRLAIADCSVLPPQGSPVQVTTPNVLGACISAQES